MPPPLQDVRVIAIEQFGAGPWGTMQLADLGAEVIKIEDPRGGGDVARYVPPFQEGESSLYFETFNRNKKSISLDLRSSAGQAVLHDLVRNADAVYNNLRGGQQRELGLTYEQLADINPRIVCCALTAYGMTGPRAEAGGYDYLLQGIAGWMSVTGEPGSPPTKSGLSLVDFGGGYVSAIALLGGLWRARRDGIGCDCDVSLFDTSLALLTYLGTWAATEGYVPERTQNSAHPSLVPFQNFRAADGWFVIACGKEKFWRRLCDAVERPEWAQDARFTDFAARNRHRAVLLSLLDDLLTTRPVAHWVSLLDAAGVPAAPVNSIPEALNDPQALARESVVEIEHPLLGTVRQIASALRVGDEVRPLARAPMRGEHTREVLRDLCGYDDERLDAWEQAGVIHAGVAPAKSKPWAGSAAGKASSPLTST